MNDTDLDSVSRSATRLNRRRFSLSLTAAVAGLAASGLDRVRADSRVQGIPSIQNVPTATSASEAVPDAVWNHPMFGFNAKGTLETEQQVRYAAGYLGVIPERLRQNLAIRVTGGTVSQTTIGGDWSDAAIRAWSDLQDSLGVRFIYVVNGNDSPVNQASLIQRWIDAGSRFDFIEMMNEYYLPKFANGDTSLPEVTQEVSAETYAQDILPRYWAALDAFGLQYYVIFAPSRPDRPQADASMTQWNEVIIRDVIEAYPQRDINATLHLYTTGKDLGVGSTTRFDYEQIDRLRGQLPPDRHLAITEAGVIDASLDSQTVGELAVTHYRQMLQHLDHGDYLLDQILYNPSRSNNVTDLSPALDGVTPKGELIRTFIMDQFGGEDPQERAMAFDGGSRET